MQALKIIPIVKIVLVYPINYEPLNLSNIFLNDYNP